MRISFLLVNYNMRGLVERCVRSISQQVSALEVHYQILIADNSTEEEQFVSGGELEAHANVTITRLSENAAIWERIYVFQLVKNPG